MRAVFLDLNGTLVMPVQAESPDAYRVIPRAASAIAQLNRKGFLCPVVTVQSRIAKGLYTETDFRTWFASWQESLAREGAYVLGPYLCPHRFGCSCPCAKPNPTLYLQASWEHDIDCTQSYVAGDTLDDMVPARHIGAKGCLVLTGWGQAAGDQGAGDAVHIGSDVRAVASWIIQDTQPDDRPCGIFSL